MGVTASSEAFSFQQAETPGKAGWRNIFVTSASCWHGLRIVHSDLLDESHYIVGRR
jgi:hypothetical protein